MTHTPAGSAPGAPGVLATSTRRSSGFFRWRGIVALIVFTGIIVLGWILFADWVIKGSIAEAATKSLGVEVEIDELDLDLRGTSLVVRGVTVAHPADPMTNVVEIGHARIRLAGAPLLRKQIVITNFIVDSVRGLTRRLTPAKSVEGGGFLPAAMAEANRWSAQFKVPLLSLTPIDTIRSLVLDPTQLQTVQTARTLAARADSARDSTIARVKALRLTETADSAEALLARLKGQSPRTLGISGTRNAISDLRRFGARVDSTKRAIEVAKANLRADVDSITVSIRELDAARKADYEFAKGLLKLPTFDAPNIGPALFGQVSLDAFEKAMYWVSLARGYVPPGLLMRESPGPERLRKSGTTIHFVQLAGTPRFHLQRGAVNLALDQRAGALRGTYALRIADITSDPQIVKRPTAFSLTREARGAGLESLLVVGTFDQTKATPTETITLRANGLALPNFAIPAVPLRLDLGRGASTLRFVMTGDDVLGRLVVASPRPVWTADPARDRRMNTLESLVSRVLTGIDNVDLTAEIRGTSRAPTLTVRSNLDRQVADNIKRVAGEEIAKAEAKVRAQVDAFVARETAAVKAKIDQAAASARAQVEQRIAEAQTRLDQAKAELAARLEKLLVGSG